MASKYLDAYLQQKAGNGRKQDEENKSTSSTGRGAGSAAASGRSGNGLDFLQRLQNETRNLYSQSTIPQPAAPAAPFAQGGQIQGSLYAQIAKQMRDTPLSQPAAASSPQGAPGLYAQAARQPAMPGLTGAQRQMIAERNTAPTMTYSQILQRNMAAARQGNVTPDMVAELEAAGRREREERQERLRQLNEDIYAASESLYTPQVQMTTQDRRELNSGVTDGMGISDVKAALPGLQESFEYARDRYQRLMDRNIRMANETGAVSPEMVAELYQAERDKNEADRRYQDALALNEQMSYSERMGNTRTDFTQVAELLAMRAEVNPQKVAREDPSRLNAAREEYQQLNDRISAVEESLRQEGYSNAEIQSLFSYLTRERNAAEMEERTEEWRQAAAERGSLGNLGINVGSGLLSGVGYLDLALQNAFAGQDAITGQRRRVDYNTGAQNAYFRGEATMQGEMDKLLEKYGEVDENGEITGMNGMGNFRAGAYQLAVSMGQSAAVAGLTAMGMPAAMLLLSGSAATQTTHQMHEQGFSDGTALLMGGIAGAAEYVTEKIGMDQLFKTRDISTAKNVLKTALQNFVNQSLAEGGEEVLSTIINTLADVIINGDRSELESRYRELLAQGMTEDQAQKIAAREWLSGVWQDFYMGAISGGLFSVGGMTFQTGRNAIIDSRTGRQIVDANVLDQLIERINTLDGKISEAANVPESFNTQSSREVGSAARAMERAQVMENMRSELAARGEENASPALLSGLYASSQQEEQRLTPEEKRALRDSRTAMELAAEWSRQWGDGTIPAPFEGLEDILRSQMEQKENAPQEGATEEGATNGEQGYSGEQTGNDADRAGREGFDNDGRAISLGMDTGNAEGQGSDRFQDLVREEVTPAALGVDNGSTTATVKVLDESRFEEGSIEAQTMQRAREMGLEPAAISGTIQIGEGENAKQARAYIKGNRVILQADGPVSMDKLLRHEEYHREARRNADLNGIIRQSLANNLSEQELNDLVADYIQAYDGIYDFSKLSQKQIEEICEEELFADLYAGIDNTGKTELRDTARSAYAEAQTMQQQNAEAERESTGPPEGRYSITAEDGEYEVLQGPNGDITIRRLADGKTGDPTGNVYILANSIPLLQTMDSVSTVKGNEVDLGKATASENIQAFFDLLGNSVYRNGLGEVELDKYGARATAVREHHPTRVKFMAVAAVPAVIQKGRVIHSEYHNGKMSYMFAAPVDFMGKPSYVAAVVHEVMQDGKPTNKYYLDEIVDAEGYRFNVENKKASVDPKYGTTTESGVTETSLIPSTNSIPDATEKSNTQNEGWASAEVDTSAAEEQLQKEQQGRPAYTVHDGVGKLFADQLDRLTEMADRQGTYYDGVQEMLMDALLEAESEEDLDRILAGKDSDKFAYTPELTEKLWELRQLIDVKGKQTEAARPVTENAQTRTENAQTRTENAQTETKDRRSLEKELQERQEAYQKASDRNDTEYDYRGEGQRIRELEQRLAEMGETTPQSAEPTAPLTQGSQDQMEAARAELLENGKATMENDTGTYTIELQEKAGNDIRARIRRDGKLERVQSFENREEAAEYALSYVDGQTKARTDAELDRERSEPIEKPGAHWPTGSEESEEIIRKKKNEAAEISTMMLRERIAKAKARLERLNRLNEKEGLTQKQRAERYDVQETLDILQAEKKSREAKRAEKKTQNTQAVPNKPTRSAAEAKNAIMDLFHTAAGNRAEVGRQIETKLAEIARNGKITEESRRELFDILIDNGMVPKHAEDTFWEIRQMLRGQRIFIGEQERADLGDNFEDLRKRAFGARIYLTGNVNDGRIDGINGELADTFGENLFPRDAALSDMLQNMIERADQGKTTQQSLSDAIEGEAQATGTKADEIFEDMFRQMDETLRTFAEKAGLEMDLKNRTASLLAEERQYRREREAELKDKNAERLARKEEYWKGREEQQKAKSAERLDKERQYWKGRMERKAQARQDRETREKALKGLQRLSKMRGKAGPEIRVQVDEVLRDIDTYSRQLTPAGLEKLLDLKKAYEEAREAKGYVDERNMGNWIPNPYVEKRLASIGKKHINDMSIEEVIELGNVVASMVNDIRTQGKMIGEAQDATTEEYANGVRADVESSRGAKAGFLHKWLMEEHLSPRRFLDMLGGWKTDGAMSKLSKSLEDGQTRMLDYQRRAVQSFDPFLSKKTNRQWLERASGKKAEWTSYEVLDGYSEDGGSYKTIELTPMMKISLYLHSRNMDNLRHIQTGGIVIPNKALYQKGKMAEAYAQGERIRMNPETVRKIAGELTETERTFANHMITLFDNISKDAINEVSLQLDGFERAGVENYMPIETDRSFLKSDVAGEARAATVEGIGSIANERVHASNPIMLSDASDVLMRQIDKVSRYYGYAIPIRNFQAVNNFVFHEEGAPFSTSIKEIMDRKWGSGAEQYITKMLEDLQSSGRRGDMMSSALAKLRGKLAGATLTLNPSVAFSQTASYPGAAQAVGWDGLAHGLVAGRVDPKLIEKYSPLYWYRNQGNSTQELGDYMNGRTLGYKMVWFLGWIQKMDSATIRRLWAASEYRVSKDNPGLRPGSQADIDAGKDVFYQKVAEVFNRAVYDTQPNYTNMERAQILRSNSDVTRFLTMYKTVPLQYYGMMVEATGRLQAAMKSGDQAKITEARKYAVNTFGGLLAANTVYVAMKALFKGIRRKDKDYRDEEGNLTAGSVAAQLGKDLAETYAGSIIGGAEMYSVAESLLTGSKFYGPEMSALSYVEDMVGAVNSIFKSIGEEDPRKAAGAIKDAAVTLAQGFGVPAQNVETYLLAGVRWMFPDVAMEYDNLFGGIERGDMKGMDEQAVGTATNLILQNRTGLKIDQSVTDELARLYSVGELAAIPTNTPSSFSYNGKTVQISNRGAYSDTWGGIVGDNLEDLVTTDDYVAADDGQRAALVNKLYQYATVEARRGADPEYSAEGNSTYGWTVKADEAVEAGVGLVDAICALDAFSHMTADKDENGNSISGSKKAKVCDYIDAMDITNEQKDVMYLLSGYKENSLEYTPWHGWDEDEESGSGSGSGSGKSGGKGSGGKRSGGRGGGSSKTKAPKTKAVKGTGSKIQLPKVSSGSGTGAGKAGGLGKGADASLSLIQIIDRYYGGNALAAAMDGGARARGRTTVDFEL